MQKKEGNKTISLLLSLGDCILGWSIEFETRNLIDKKS